MSKKKKLVAKYHELEGLIKGTITGEDFGLAPQKMKGKLRLKISGIRKYLMDKNKAYQDARTDIIKGFVEFEGDKPKRKGDKLVFKKGKKEEKLNEELEELAKTEVDLDMQLLTRAEVEGLELNNETLIYLSDVELNDLLK